MCSIRLLLGLIVLAVKSPMVRGVEDPGIFSSTGGAIGGHDEKVEGCFTTFAMETCTALGPDNINNLRCQALCSDQGYPLAATKNFTCFCGNVYPSLIRRVNSGQCDRPCSPDRSTCLLHTCCGSRDNQLFTVGWSGEIDPMKQILRRLAHDYRNSTTFRQKIEGKLCDRVTLKTFIAEPDQPSNPPSPPLFLSIRDGCPGGWYLFENSCYKMHMAEPSTYNQACGICEAEGGNLVTVTSEAENCFLRQLHDGCQGWVANAVEPASTNGGSWSSTSSKNMQQEEVVDDKSCRHLGGNGTWRSVSCGIKEETSTKSSLPNQALCEKLPSSVDGCKGDSWMMALGKCYLILQQGAFKRWSWLDARAACHRLNGYLAVMQSLEEYDTAGRLLGPEGGFIGIYKASSSSDEWRWDGFDNSRKHVISTQGPSVKTSSFTVSRDPCYVMQSDGIWTAIDCNERKPHAVICKRPALNGVCGQCPSSVSVKGSEWHSYGCSCYLQKVTGGGGGGPELSWMEAQAMCGSLGGRLVWIESKEENEWLLNLLKLSLTFNKGFLPAYIGLNNILDHHKYVWSYYENWQADYQVQQMSAWTQYQDDHCAQMTREGRWIKASCEGQRASCFVCKKPRAGSSPALRPHAAEEWHVEVVNARNSGTSEPPPYAWCDDSFQSYLKHDKTGQYLCVDASSLVYLSYNRDPCWCLLTFVVDEETGAMVVLTRDGTAMFHDESGTSTCFRPLPSYLVQVPARDGKRHGSSRSFLRELFSVDGIVKFYTEPMLLPLAPRYLRITIQSTSRRAPELGQRDCSIALYDLNPKTPSFMCRYRPNVLTENQNLVFFDQVGLLVTDRSGYWTAREPLPNGRTTCLNESPTETVNCVFAYGQALTLIRRFRAQFGYIIFDTATNIEQIQAMQSQVFRYQAFGAAGPAAGVPSSQRSNQLTTTTRETLFLQNALTGLFNNFYQTNFLRIIVETLSWQIGVQVTPRTALTMQFWLTTYYLYYRWRALFEARGGFIITMCGQPIGKWHSLGDVTNGNDLTFSVFGVHEEPVEASLILNDREENERSFLGFPQQVISEGDEVSPRREFLPPSP